jgi:RHS repeat-associated protein
MDRVTSIVWKNASSNVVKSFAYQYNNASMITNMVLEDGSSRAYSYDDLDRLTSETMVTRSGWQGSTTSTVSYGWDQVGNRLTKTNGGTTVSYQYSNGCNRLTGWSATSVNGFTNAVVLSVSGDASTNIVTNPWLGQLWVSPAAGSTQPTNGMTPSVNGTNFSIAALPIGIGTQKIVAAISDIAGNPGYATNTVTVHIYTNGAYQYSPAGCVTNIQYLGAGATQNMALTWNGQYQLTAVTTNGIACERNGFDAFGRRVWNWNGTTTNYFVYDGQQVIADLNSTGGLVRSYVWGPGIDNLLAMTVHTGTTAVTYYAIRDHLGSVQALADTNGVIAESYKFDAWGKLLGVFNGNGLPLAQSAIGIRYLWQGREYNYNTGMYFFRARFYDPNIGRWISNDPIGISRGLNQYMFCSDNPVNYIDPDGCSFMSGLAGAASGAASGTVAGAGVGAIIGAVGGAGIGAGPGAIAGAVAGAVGGAISGFVSGAFQDTVGQGAASGAIAGAMAGATGGAGAVGGVAAGAVVGGVTGAADAYVSTGDPLAATFGAVSGAVFGGLGGDAELSGTGNDFLDYAASGLAGADGQLVGDFINGLFPKY